MLKKFFWVLFCILIVGCKPDRVEPDPIPPPPPSVPTVTLDVPATAGYLQDVTITWSSLNATTVAKSFVEGTEVTGSFIVKAIAKTTTFSITGEGAGGTITVEKTVSVKIPTAVDTLMAHGWNLKGIETWKISTNTYLYEYILDNIRLSDVLFFTADGFWHKYHFGETTSFGGGKFSLVGKTLIIGDPVYRLTFLNDLKLEYELDDPWAVDQVIKYFYEKANN